MKFFYKKLKTAWKLFKDTVNNFLEDNMLSLSASLAYYTVFSFGPIVVIVIALTGLFFGEEVGRGEVYRELNGLLGKKAAIQVQEVVENAYLSGSSRFAAIISAVTLFFGATGVFVELKNSLNIIWRVEASARNGIIQFIFDRLLSFTMVLSIGFILLVSLMFNVLVLAASHELGVLFPSISDALLMVVNMFVAILIPVIVFAITFKNLPDAEVQWRHVWMGAIVTGILFSFGKNLIGYYIGNSTITDAFGTAGSLAALLVWAYYSALILFLGAEFTHVYAKKIENRILPSEQGVKIKVVKKKIPPPPEK